MDRSIGDFQQNMADKGKKREGFPSVAAHLQCLVNSRMFCARQWHLQIFSQVAVGVMFASGFGHMSLPVATIVCQEIKKGMGVFWQVFYL